MRTGTTDTTEMIYTIQGLDCAEVARVLKATVGELTEVHDLRFDVPNGRMTVVFDPAAVTDVEIRRGVEHARLKAVNDDESEPERFWKHRGKRLSHIASSVFLDARCPRA